MPSGLAWVLYARRGGRPAIRTATAEISFAGPIARFSARAVNMVATRLAWVVYANPGRSPLRVGYWIWYTDCRV